MKIPSITLAALVLTVALTEAGSFGPGPWANGAYYPGQFDGVYSASAYGTNLGGVIGFALKGGKATTLTSGGSNSIAVDPNQNYFVIYCKGRSYAGETIGTVNNVKSSVSGGLYVGSSVPTSVTYYSTNSTYVTNTPTGPVYDTTVTVTTADVPNGAGGEFTAKLKADNAIITFSGEDTGTFSTTFNGAPISTNTFSLSGLKVAN